MPKALLSILLAFTAYSILNIAQACQKIGLGLLSESRLKGWTIWSAATLATSLSIFIGLYAVSIGNVSLVGAMAGSGLASLALFSRLVMKEKSSAKEILGIFVILTGAALIGALSRETAPENILLNVLFVMLASVALFYILSWLIFLNKRGLIGILIGGFAGSLGGFVPLFQKLSTSSFGRSRSLAAHSSGLGEILTNPYALVWIVLSVISMLVLQFSYKRDKAIRIIPAFSANYIMIPVVGGVICFQEKLYALQWLGIVIILSGVFLITVKPPKYE